MVLTKLNTLDTAEAFPVAILPLAPFSMELFPELAKDEEIEMVVQVNGKVRERLMVAADVTEDEVKETALENEKVKVFTDGKEIKKIIFVPGRLINIVVN